MIFASVSYRTLVNTYLLRRMACVQHAMLYTTSSFQYRNLCTTVQLFKSAKQCDLFTEITRENTNSISQLKILKHFHGRQHENSGSVSTIRVYHVVLPCTWTFTDQHEFNCIERKDVDCVENSRQQQQQQISVLCTSHSDIGKGFPRQMISTAGWATVNSRFTFLVEFMTTWGWYFASTQQKKGTTAQ